MIKDKIKLEFRVRQRTPANLNQAVAATLELETYLLKMSKEVVGMNSTREANIAATASKSSCFELSLEKIVER